MANPTNLLEQLVMQLREPQDPNAQRADSVPRRQAVAPVEDQVLATLLAQALQPGERVPPASVIRPQLANDLGMPEEDLTQNIMGSQNLIQAGISQQGSLLETLAADMGRPTEDLRQILRGNAMLSNVEAARQESVTQDREATVKASQNVPEPDSESILQGLLAEARGVTESGNPDQEAAFHNKLGRMMRSPASTPAERKAAYQLRHPDMQVEVQEDGVMSFSDKGPGLQVSDEKTRRAVDNVRAKLETLSPDQPIVVGEGSEIAALAASTKQRIADNIVNSRTTLFGPSSSQAVGDIQNELQSIVNIGDPTERAIALQRMGPRIAAYGNQRRSELRNQTFEEMGVPELERSLAVQEARDRSDPRWDEFRSDSPKTASTRAQLRQARSDALTLVEQRVQSDPMLNTLQSQTAMTEAIVARKGSADSSIQLSERLDMLSPQEQNRIKTAMKSLHPDKDISKLTGPDAAKIYTIDEDFYGAVAALNSPSKTISMLAVDTKNAAKWQSYLKQAELNAGADEHTATQLQTTYTNIANGAQRILAGGMDEAEMRKQGGEVRALAEQWNVEKRTLSPSEMANRRDNYYLPQIVKAKLGYLQHQQLEQADLTYTNLKPTTTHAGVNDLLTEAASNGYKLGDLMNPNRLVQLKASLPQGNTTGPGRYGTSAYQTKSRPGILNDPEARMALAKYIATARVDRMLKTAFMDPIDTTQDVERKLQIAAVTSITNQGIPQ